MVSWVLEMLVRRTLARMQLPIEGVSLAERSSSECRYIVSEPVVLDTENIFSEYCVLSVANALVSNVAHFGELTPHIVICFSQYDDLTTLRCLYSQERYASSDLRLSPKCFFAPFTSLERPMLSSCTRISWQLRASMEGVPNGVDVPCAASPGWGLMVHT
jgi:hypothetical protein